MSGSETTYHVKDVGRILLEVQSQLKDIRQVIDGTDTREEQQREVLIRSLDNVLRSAETDLRTKAELVLNSSVQDSVNTLPSTGARQPPSSAAQQESFANRLTSPPRASPGRVPRVRQRVEDARRLQLLTDPNSEFSREYLRRRYGISEPDRHAAVTAGQERRVSAARSRRASQHGRVRPVRVAPTAGTGPMARQSGATTAAIPADALEQGMYNLMERGYVPPNADLTPAFTHGTAALHNTRAVMHHPAARLARPETHVDTTGFNVASLRLDTSDPAPPKAAVIAGRVVKAAPPPPPRRAGLGTTQLAPDMGAGEGSQGAWRLDEGVEGEWEERGGSEEGDEVRDEDEGEGEGEGEDEDEVKEGSGTARESEDAALRHAVDKIRGYNELLDAYSLHQFLIRRGQTLRATPEFQSFQRTHKAEWGGIARVVRMLEELFSRYAVPVVYIDGQLVARLAQTAVGHISDADLLGCVANADEVSRYVRLPGQRFKGPRARHEAVVCVQAAWRMVVQRRQYREKKREIRAAFVIQRATGLWMTVQRHRRRIEARRAEEEEEWNALCDRLRRRWKEIRRKRRVAVHLPSLSWDKRVRASLPNLALREAAQLQRLVATADPLVEVVLVVPFPVSEEVLAYYRKLLSVGGVTDPSLRLRVVVPENADRLPSTLSLASLALYSPRCVQRIASSVRGKEAYLVPGQVGPDDRRLALRLGIPLLGPGPEAAALYGSKSGAKRLLSIADVNMPPGAHDLYEEEEVVAALARLVARHPDVPKWLIKIDDEHGGRGTAYLETRHLPSAPALQRDRARREADDPGYWARPEVQEAARATLLSEVQRTLPRRAVMACRAAYPTYAAFMGALCEVGGVVEACATGVRGSPSANLFVAPDGRVTLTSTHDQVFDAPFRFAGAAFPQQSVPPGAMLGASTAVGAALHAKGVVGYVSVDFVAWSEGEAGALRLWAVDINLRITPTCASFAMFNFLMGGRFDAVTGEYKVLREQDAGVDASSTATGSTAGSSRHGRSRGAARPATAFRFDGDTLASEDASEGGDSASATLTARSGASHSTASLSTTADGDGRNASFETRHYVAVPFITHSGLASLQYTAFFNQCRLNGIAFDLRRRVGTAFLLVDSLVSGAIGALSVGHTPVAALQNCASTMRFIEGQVGARPPESEFDVEPSNFADIHDTVRAMLKAAGLPATDARARRKKT